MLLGAWLLSCQDPAGTGRTAPPDPPAPCDGHGDSCTTACCEAGTACQHGFCIDAAHDLDADGVPAAWDCDDYDRTVHPGAPEVCDSKDNNCNGTEDEGVRNADGTCHPPCEDLDQDGEDTCAGDCDDTDATVNTGADEVCDGKDNDCNGIADDGFDADGDGVGACQDCDDTDMTRASGFQELCDGVDNDCNELVDDGRLCGALGTCAGGRCTWHFDAGSDDVEHDDGYPGRNGGWCAGPDEPASFNLVGAPARGTRDFPYGIFLATFTASVSDNTTSWGDCGTALRLRANDRDGDGSGTCRTCWFGGDVALVPRHFATAGRIEEHDLRFSIGPERSGHVIEVVALRGSCRAVEVCVGEVDIVQQ